MRALPEKITAVAAYSPNPALPESEAFLKFRRIFAKSSSPMRNAAKKILTEKGRSVA